MQYEEIIEIIQSKRRFGKAYGRDVTAEMMDLLGHPEEGMQIIHIAGTNGKGSTAAFVSSILHAAGFVVGRFTSPHLIRFTERIVVDGQEISKEDVVRFGEQLLDLPMTQECTMFDLCFYHSRISPHRLPGKYDRGDRSRKSRNFKTGHQSRTWNYGKISGSCHPKPGGGVGCPHYKCG